ncbi:MAG TPA: hypothetical protein V6D31_05315 [Candidatus Sericytochromatia bacterium]
MSTRRNKFLAASEQRLLLRLFPHYSSFKIDDSGNSIDAIAHS